jgi:predicted kinase
MRKFRLLIITGLPGTGKTTLARDLARRHTLPLICKDTIKEPLLDLLGTSHPSRDLSDLSFAILFAQAREQLALGASLILEGNFRAGEHEAPLLAALPPLAPDIVQVLCTADEAERRARLLRRATDARRHPGHRDAQQLEPVAGCDSYLELPGERRTYRVGLPPCETFF